MMTIWNKSALWRTLKGRMIVILLLSSIAPLALLGIISYSSFHSFLQNTLKNAIQENVKKDLIGIDNIFKNMNFASQQIALDMEISSKISTYLTTDDILEKKQIRLDVQKRMALINYSSPHAGIIAILDGSDKKVVLNNSPVVDVIDPDLHPVVVKVNGIGYHAPHPSANKYREETEPLVFSLSRKVTDYQKNTSYYLYLESNFRSLPQLFNGQHYGEPVTHLILNPDGMVVYSSDTGRFPVGSEWTPESASRKDFMHFEAVSDQQWRTVVVMEGEAFSAEVNAWFYKFVMIVLFALALCLLLAFVAWRSIYRPLQVFRKEIERMGEQQAIRSRKLLHLSEFDDVLGRFYEMRTRVYDLVREIERREQARSRFEVEKLRYQINPHFIHNTLNTVQVIAKIQKQDEIVRLITYFTRILHYNLGKEGAFVQVRQEIANLKDYIALQQIRYNHAFQMKVQVDPDVEGVTVPRFILQPLVENALYHGFKNDEGVITVLACREADDHIRIEVADNGVGMSGEQVAALLPEQGESRGRSGMGIGLPFVQQLIKSYYGNEYGIQIESEPGRGTTLTIRVPDRVKEGTADD
ncbi:histidine kinase [Paenibacillus sp. 32O-W]|uniref:cache domain-containing sensor histidine kinase n=1 Tax=Paenibacillus sp. 32O-W TaxID=1695218 RepID=UPI00071FA0B8|nr:histidine kinase [Paenibacillus sp. 32O-W]ALS29959.1 histidine kinase [Paenibacillus sp. 32O-W]